MVLISLLSVRFCFVCLVESDVVKWTRCFWKDGDRTVVDQEAITQRSWATSALSGVAEAGIDRGLVCLVLSRTV